MTAFTASPDSPRFSLRALAGDSFVYAVGAALLGLGNFALVPLLTRRLTVSEFGLYALLDIAVLIVVSVSQLKLDVSYLRFFSLDDQDALLSTVLGLGSAAALLGGLLLALVVTISGLSWLPQVTGSEAAILVAVILLENLHGLLLSDLRARRKAVEYCAGNVVRLFVMVGGTVWALSLDGPRIQAVFVGRLLGDLAGAGALAWFCRTAFHWRLNSRLVRPMLAFGLPIVWSSLMVLLMDASGRVLLTRYGGLEQVGYLAVAVKISGVFQLLITQPFGIAWGGVMFQIVKLPNAQAIYSGILRVILICATGLTLTMASCSGVLLRIFAPIGYSEALVAVPIAILIRALSLIEYPSAIGIYLYGRTKWLALVYTLGLVLNVGINIVFDQTFGLRGVLLAWFAGWVLIIGLELVVGQRHYRLQLPWGMLATCVVLWVSLFAGGRFLVVVLGASVVTQLVAAGVLGGFTGLLLLREVRKLSGYSSLRYSLNQESVNS